MNYTNPVIPGFHPDPSICRVGDDYYLVTSTFEYFPGVPIFHSKDLVNWRQSGHCLTTEQQLPLGKAWSSGGIFAPTIRYHEGWFYMTTTNVSGIGNFYVRSQHPEGPWSNPITIDQPGIDPSLLFDDDGKVYFQSSCSGDEGDGIYQCEIEIATGRRLTERRLLWKGTGGAYPEAPHLYKINGYYYLMVAEGGTEYGHMETVARSADPYGPFEPCPHNPILSNRSRKSSIHATGHADLIEAHDGSWWAVCLGIRPAAYPMRHHLGRETFLAQVTWTADGWPIIGSEGHIDPRMEGPSWLEVRLPIPSERDDFDNEQLSFDWTFLRNPELGSWSLRERPGYLTLRGNKASLNDGASPAFVGRRLSHFTCSAAASLDFEPIEGEEAGLTVYMNEKYHYEAAVQVRDGRKVVVFRRTVGSLSVEQVYACESGTVVLRIDAQPETFTFLMLQEGSEAVKLGWGETHLLSTEVAGGFTGIFLAMYASSAAAEQTPAYFDWFDYIPID